MAFNEKVSTIGEAGYHLAEQSLSQTLFEVNRVSQDPTHLLYASILYAGASLRFISSLIANGDGREKQHKANKETMLTAALMAARIIQPKDDGIESDFSARNIVAAIELAKTISKREDFDSLFDQNMLKTYRETVHERGLSLGYWDYLEDVGPTFDGFDIALKSFTKH